MPHVNFKNVRILNWQQDSFLSIVWDVQFISTKNNKSNSFSYFVTVYILMDFVLPKGRVCVLLYVSKLI